MLGSVTFTFYLHSEKTAREEEETVKEVKEVDELEEDAKQEDPDEDKLKEYWGDEPKGHKLSR